VGRCARGGWRSFLVVECWGWVGDGLVDGGILSGWAKVES
jgi:hypothetical protein